MSQPLLYYIHDPMCSWCYGFDRTRRELFEALDNRVTIRRLVGGLAPDNQEPMPFETQAYIQTQWHKIEERIPGVHFNFDFWEQCKPRRSTYPACRAVIAAREFGEQYDERMTAAVQQAYYQRAMNPSDDDTLIRLAAEIGLDDALFVSRLKDTSTHRKLQDELEQVRELGVDSFPSLVLHDGAQSRSRILVDYNDAGKMRQQIDDLLS